MNEARARRAPRLEGILVGLGVLACLGVLHLQWGGRDAPFEASAAGRTAAERSTVAARAFEELPEAVHRGLPAAWFVPGAPESFVPDVAHPPLGFRAFALAWSLGGGTFRDRVGAMRAVTLGLEFLALLAIAALGARQSGPIGAALAPALWLTAPAVLRQGDMADVAGLGLHCMPLVLWSFLRWRDRRRGRDLLAYAAVATVAGLTSREAAFVIPPLVLAVLVAGEGARGRGRDLLLTLLPWGLALGASCGLILYGLGGAGSLSELRSVPVACWSGDAFDHRPRPQAVDALLRDHWRAVGPLGLGFAALGLGAAVRFGRWRRILPALGLLLASGAQYLVLPSLAARSPWFAAFSVAGLALLGAEGVRVLATRVVPGGGTRATAIFLGGLLLIVLSGGLLARAAGGHRAGELSRSTRDAEQAAFLDAHFARGELVVMPAALYAEGTRARTQAGVLPLRGTKQLERLRPALEAAAGGLTGTWLLTSIDRPGLPKLVEDRSRRDADAVMMEGPGGRWVRVPLREGWFRED